MACRAAESPVATEANEDTLRIDSTLLSEARVVSDDPEKSGGEISPEAFRIWFESYGELQSEALDRFSEGVPTEHKKAFSEFSMTVFGVDLFLVQATTGLAADYTFEKAKESFAAAGTELLSIEQEGECLITTFLDSENIQNTLTFKFDEASGTIDLTLEKADERLLHFTAMANEKQFAKSFQGGKGGKSAEFFYDRATHSGIIGLDSSEVEPTGLFKNPDAARATDFGEKFGQIAALENGVLDLR